MTNQWSRRRFLGTAASLTAFGAVSWPEIAAAKTSITAVEWGGDVIKAMKQIAAAQSGVDVNWVLFQGGSGSILPKIKASWPNPAYDYVAGWEGSFNTMVSEDWLVPVSVAQIPEPRGYSRVDDYQGQAGGVASRAQSGGRYLLRL